MRRLRRGFQSLSATSSTVNHADNDVTKAVISTDADGATIDEADATGVYTLTGGAGVDKPTGSAGADTIDGAAGAILLLRLVWVTRMMDGKDAIWQVIGGYILCG